MNNNIIDILKTLKSKFNGLDIELFNLYHKIITDDSINLILKNEKISKETKVSKMINQLTDEISYTYYTNNLCTKFTIFLSKDRSIDILYSNGLVFVYLKNTNKNSQSYSISNNLEIAEDGSHWYKRTKNNDIWTMEN